MPHPSEKPRAGFLRAAGAGIGGECGEYTEPRRGGDSAEILTNGYREGAIWSTLRITRVTRGLTLVNRSPQIFHKITAPDCTAGMACGGSLFAPPSVYYVKWLLAYQSHNTSRSVKQTGLVENAQKLFFSLKLFPKHGIIFLWNYSACY